MGLNDVVEMGVCGLDQCEYGQKIKNMGTVRVKAIVNGYCPFVGTKEQIIQIVFDSGTLKNLGEDSKGKVTSISPQLDGLCLPERNHYLTNCIVDKNFIPVKSDTEFIKELWRKVEQEPGKDPPFIPYLAKQAFVPHYTWVASGSLFDTTSLSAAEMDKKEETPKPGETVSKAVWTYKHFSVPEFIEYEDDNTTKVVYPNNVYFPSQSKLPTTGEAIHWSLVKIKRVFQNADMFFEFYKNAWTDVKVKSNRKMLSQRDMLDVSTGLTLDGKTAGIPVNGAVVTLDEKWLNVKEKDNYNLNNQSYVMMELGAGDPDHWYLILIPEKANPIFIHITKSVPCAVPGSRECPTRILKPTRLYSRRLSTFSGVNGSELLKKDRLRVGIRHYMGKIVITFSGYEKNPWIVSRRDIESPQQDPNGDEDNNDTQCKPQEDPDNFQEVDVHMNIPVGLVALHGGNYSTAVVWGYQKYDANAVIDAKAKPHIMGTSNSLPSAGSINVLLGHSNTNTERPGFRPEDLATLIGIDQRYHQQALVMSEWVDGKASLNPVWGRQAAQMNKWRKRGVGVVPLKEKGKKKNKGMPSVFLSQSESLRCDKKDKSLRYSSIAVSVDGNARPVRAGEPRSVHFKVLCVLSSGDFVFSTYLDAIAGKEAGASFVLRNVITPICTGYTIIIPSQGQAWKVSNSIKMDVSNYVSKYSDSWTAQDYYQINHTGQLNLLCNRGMNGGDPMADKIASLTDRSFYIQLWAWRHGSEAFVNLRTDQPYAATDIPTDDEVIFTGMCHPGRLIYGNSGARMLECQLVDLSKVLQDQHFLNSPFFDSVRDFVAVYDILRLAGFRGTAKSKMTSSSLVEPASFVARCVNLSRNPPNGKEPFEVPYYDGLGVYSKYVNSYALPGSYSPLQSPKFKFQDGSKMWDAIIKFAQLGGKCVYFDRFGIMRFEGRSDQDMFLNPDTVTPSVVRSLARANFYSSPRKLPGQTKTPTCGVSHALAYNGFTWQRHQGDVFNQIQCVTMSPNGEAFMVGDVNFDSLDHPNSTGFVGYCKQLLQMDGVFGSLSLVKDNARRLTSSYTPATSISWEAYGRAFLKALDVIMFTGIDPYGSLNNAMQPMPLRLTNVSNDLDPIKNVWWARFEGEWLAPGRNIDWSADPV